jgi:hypothetical protein
MKDEVLISIYTYVEHPWLMRLAFVYRELYVQGDQTIF